jgi:hypothetical protein
MKFIRNLFLIIILLQIMILLYLKIVYTKTQKKTFQINPTVAIAPVCNMKLPKPEPLSKSIAHYAKDFLGKKYVWGATGPNTFDCSGFTKVIYAKTAGIKLPRHSSHQAKVGGYVSFSQLKQGDMVFFDTSHKHKGGVNHVGIYLGDGNFIHASSGGKRVMITNFNKKRFYKNRFLWGRRVIPEKRTRMTFIPHSSLDIFEQRGL